ncbi:MAG: hypothetical protein LRY54_01425 [Alphaproteobacteria bacterium]|nr:hypothetical protein [Alphaproteobacteria bacterium]
MLKSIWKKALAPIGVGIVYGMGATAFVQLADLATGNNIETLAQNIENRVHAPYQGETDIPYWVERYHKSPEMPFYFLIFAAAGIAGGRHWKKAMEKADNAKPEANL